MKTCTKCGETKPLLEFNKRARSADGHQQHCKSCHKVHNLRHYAKDKEKYLERGRKWTKNWLKTVARPIIAEAKVGGCSVCGEKREWCLDFHHLDPKEKDLDIAALKMRGQERLLRDEIAKCIVVCRNCHADIHYQQRISV